jgi:hypothetical protein
VSTTTSSNYTSLYGGAGGTVSPTSPYGNANVVSLLAVGTDGANTVGNITSTGQVTATGNIQTSAFFIGDGSLITNLPGGSYGNSNVAAFLPTYTGAMTAMTGAVTTTANITGSYILGNGSQLTGIAASYGNANVAANLAAFGSNPVSTTGNITAGNFVGSGAALTSITGGNVTGTVANATFATSAAAATTAGTVTTAAQPNITSTGTLTSVATTGNISATGNITGNYYIGNGSLLTGITGSGTYGDANVVTLMGAFGSNTINTTGNVTSGNLIISNVGNPRIVGWNGVKLNFAGPTSNLALLGSDDSVGSSTLNVGNISTVGNITSNYYIGNGSLLTGITGTGTYGNANVVALMSSFGSNIISTTGNITGGNLVTGGNVDATRVYAGSIEGGNISTSGVGGNVTTSRLNASTLSLSGNVVSDLVVTGNNAGGTIGNIRALGSISAVGNISANGNVLAGNVNGGNVNATYVNATTAIISPSGQFDTVVVAGAITATGSNISAGNISLSGSVQSGATISAAGNITGGNLRTGGIVSAGGNITAPYFIGNGSQLTGITTTYGNSNVAAFLPVYGGSLFVGNITVDQANGAVISAGVINSSTIISTGDLQVGTSGAATIVTPGTITGNIITGNSYVSTAGYVTAVGNVTGSYFIGNGSQLTGITAAPGGSNTQIQFNNGGAFGGNANVTFNVSTGNLDSYNNRLTTANVTTTVQPYDDSVVNATTVNPGRIIFGTGVNGNLTADMDASGWLRSSLFLVNQNITKGDNGRRTSGASFDLPVTLSGNLANASTRITATRQALTIGGANVYGMTSTNINAYPSAVNATVTAGTNGNVVVGNITLVGTIAASVNTQTTGTSTIGTAIGTRADFSGNIGNTTGLQISTALSAVGTTVSVVLNAAANHNTNARSSTGYYFLNNTDDVAQNKLGSLLRYTEYAYVNSTSGSITIDKNNGQVQSLTLTGNVTGITLSNFVTTASDGTNTDPQADTVTVAFNQGATGGYGVTFPTQSSTVKYAGNVTALQSTAANSVTLVSISAMYLNSATTYLITISPGFV